MTRPSWSRLSYLCLLTWQAVWHFALPAPWGSHNWILAVVASLPLLIPLRGVIALHQRAMTWASYLILIYLMAGITEAWSNPPQRMAALVQVALCGLFLGTVLKARRGSGV